jgi:predicted ArsR family transcriptional regulator
MANEAPPPKMVDDRLAAALSHDTREHALAMCSLRPTSTKEVAEDLDITVSAAWYHMDKLRALGCIEEVDSRRRRGAIEHFYAATCTGYFDSKAWDAVARDKRLAISMRVLRLISGDVDRAVRAKTISAPDRHLSRTVIDLDPQGEAEAYAVLGAALEGLLRVRGNCVARQGKGDANTTRTSLVWMQLKLPPPGSS